MYSALTASWRVTCRTSIHIEASTGPFYGVAAHRMMRAWQRHLKPLARRGAAHLGSRRGFVIG
jgi:hypothetical protein